MLSNVGPTHYLFYGALHRRRLWLEYLASAFHSFTIREGRWPEQKKDLDTRFHKLLHRLSNELHLGIQKTLPLTQILDDTPIESFLTNLAEDLQSYEEQFFELLLKNRTEKELIEILAETSTLWGREVAQECLLSLRVSPFLRNKNSVQGLFEAFHSILQGGEFTWKPLLVRRYTEKQLQYELRKCPHTRANQHISEDAYDLACRLDSLVYQGFTEALNPKVYYQRTFKGKGKKASPCCIDTFEIG